MSNNMNSVCNPTGDICASFPIPLSSSNSLVTIVLETSTTGWVGVGFKGTMMDEVSAFVIAWEDASKGPMASLRSSTPYGEMMPNKASNQSDVTILGSASSLITLRQNTKVAVAFAVPQSYFSANGSTNLIYAAGSEKPKSDSDIAFHDFGQGSFSYNVHNGESTAAVSSAPPAYYVQHGAIMFVAWGVIPYFIIFVARYLKFKLGHTWFHIHAAGGGLGILSLTIAGVSIMAVGNGLEFGGTTHEILGWIVVLGVLPVQILLGVVADRLFKPDRPAIPWWDQAHWWLGRLSLVLTCATIHLGLSLAGFGNGWIIAFWIWIVAMVSALVAGHFVLGAAHHTGTTQPSTDGLIHSKSK